MPLPVRKIQLRRRDRKKLERLTRSRTAPRRVVERAEIVLGSSRGESGNLLCERLGVSRPTVTFCLDRYEAGGLPAIVSDRPRSGRPKRNTALDAEIIRRTKQEAPPSGTHWTTRLMAQQTGVSQAHVWRLWQAHGLAPHQVDYFKLSTDPFFVEKLRDVVGLYLNPPERAVVFSLDEKSQIQALNRTQPGLPMKKGRAGTMTHDYERHGTTTLFAALDVATGKVLYDCMPRHRHQEFLRFLKTVEQSVPDDLDIHVILDNYGTHKHDAIQRWLQRHPRVFFHFVPTSASWLNLVELLFNELQNRQLKRLAVTSVGQLIAAISAYLERRNQDPKPFVWTATADKILRKVRRAQKALNDVKQTSESKH
ncbi:MAG: IS630 family transposase [Longimicrobiales bacterium]